jgi:hypothetical protein
MNRFVELFRHKTPPPPGKIYADERSDLFPEVVSGSTTLTLWDRADGIPTTGHFLLIGVATWSGYDMNMLDHIERVIPERPNVRVRVFDTDTFKTPEEFEAVFPGIGSIHHTPAVGYWIDGHLIDRDCGYAGRELIARVLELDARPLHEKIPAS